MFVSMFNLKGLMSLIFLKGKMALWDELKCCGRSGASITGEAVRYRNHLYVYAEDSRLAPTNFT